MNDRQERLDQFRMNGQSRSGANQTLLCRDMKHNGSQYADEKKYMPYWANYLLRTCIVGFCLMCTCLYNMNHSPTVSKWSEWVRENMCYNSLVKDAYQTYTSVDYKKMMKDMKIYIKEIAQR